MFKIAPSILAADFGRLAECVAKVEEAGADLIHVDVMDGHFVPNISIGIPVLESLRRCTDLPLDVHLMIAHPAAFVERFIDAGASMISVHVEADPHLHRTVGLVRERGIIAGVAINPGTSLQALDSILESVDFVLLMTVNPGFGGQRFIPSSIPRIKQIRTRIVEQQLAVQVEVDGGIDQTNFQAVAAAGADILVAGSAIFSSDDPAATVKHWNGVKYTHRHV